MPDIDALAALALEAGEAILGHWRDGVEVAHKDDKSPVTAADHEAEAIIEAGLQRLAPGEPLVAEEAAAAGRVPDTVADFWLVDPLDGTKEFVKGPDGKGEFTVNIGRIVAGVPTTGVVYAPALGRLYAASGPGDAWQAEVTGAGAAPVIGPRRAIKVSAPDADGVIAVASRSHRTPETDAYLAKFTVKGLRSAGSSLKFCLVATGEAQLYPRLGPTMEWDTAAGDAILRAAGGRCVTLDGKDLAYSKRGRADAKDFLNPSFVCLGDLAFVEA